MRRVITLSAFLVLLNGMSGFAVVPDRVGWWKFDDPSNLMHATTGFDLILEGEGLAEAGPVEGNGAIKVGQGSYLIMQHGIYTPVNEYTIQIDFSLPQLGVWNAMFQTDVDNLDDGECFVNESNHIGAWRVGYSENTLELDTWYRLVVTVINDEFYRLYINGELWVDGTPQESNGRDALAEMLLVFADENGEDADIICSELGIWDIALNAEEVAELGNASQPYTVSIPDKSTGHGMDQNYPNPFSYLTTINYHISSYDEVTFHLYDFSGREIQVIREGYKFPGDHSLTLSAENLPAGAYSVRMESDSESLIQRMIIMK